MGGLKPSLGSWTYRDSTDDEEVRLLPAQEGRG